MFAGVNVMLPPAFMLVTLIVAAPTPLVAIVQFWRVTVGDPVGDAVGVGTVLLEAKSSQVYSPAVMLCSVINVKSELAVRLASKAVLFLGHVWCDPCGSDVNNTNVTVWGLRLVTDTFIV
jgi:hypothetical protein